MLPSFLIGALAIQIHDDLDVGVEAVAAGVTVFFLAGALGAGWGGRLADHIGALRAIRRCVFVTAASLGAAALAPSLATLFLLLAVAGLANAVTQPAINLFVAEQIPADRQGLGFGIKQSGIPAAILVSGLALPVLALPFGWRVTVALCALGPLAVALALPADGQPHVSRRPASRRPSRALLLTALGAALGTAGPSALGAYLVASAVNVGIAEGTAGLLAAVASGLSLAARVSLGARADRRRDYGLAAVVILLAAGSLGFALMASDSDGALRGRRAGGVHARLGLARALQPGGRGREPRDARKRHRREPDRHLRGRGRRPGRVRRAGRGPRLWDGLAGRGGHDIALGGDAVAGRSRNRGLTFRVRV